MSDQSYDFVMPSISHDELQHTTLEHPDADQSTPSTELSTMSDLKPQDPTSIKLQFRTYKPYSKDLRPYQMQSSTSLQDFSWITEESNQILSEYISFDQDGTDFIDNNDLYAKPTWDLKRDIQPQLHLLNKRTQESIEFLMQKKLIQEQLNQHANNTMGE